MKEVARQIRSLHPGDLIRVDWFDASIGKSLGSGLGGIDVPVCSWGVFVGVLGEKHRHIILAQNSFRYSDNLYDIDYTAVPTTWTVNITVIFKNHVKADEAKNILNSFLSDPKHSSGRKIKQQKVRNHNG